MDSHPKFGLVVIHTARGYEKVSYLHNEHWEGAGQASQTGLEMAGAGRERRLA